MRGTRITPDIAKQIAALRGKSGVKDMADQLGLKYTTVRNHIRRTLEGKDLDRFRSRAKKNKVKRGFFNEHERENWLV